MIDHTRHKQDRTPHHFIMHRGADHHKAPLLTEDYEQLGEGITFFSSECSCYWQVAHALVHNHPLMLAKETIIIPNGSKKKHRSIGVLLGKGVLVGEKSSIRKGNERMKTQHINV